MIFLDTVVRGVLLLLGILLSLVGLLFGAVGLNRAVDWITVPVNAVSSVLALNDFGTPMGVALVDGLGLPVVFKLSVGEALAGLGAWLTKPIWFMAGGYHVDADAKQTCKGKRWLFAPIYLLAGLLVVWLVFSSSACAEPIPRAALPYRNDLLRLAHAEWGLDAPIAAFAAQIHQESAWNPKAVSQVGAQGLSQFMPATAKWMRESFPQLKTGTPENPQWAIRAMVAYDRWLYRRVKGYNEGDKFWAALRSYNGGLGHWQKEAALVGSLDRATVDSACGKASRGKQFCAENLGYPRRILLSHQPRYLAWGRGV